MEKEYNIKLPDNLKVDDVIFKNITTDNILTILVKFKSFKLGDIIVKYTKDCKIFCIFDNYINETENKFKYIFKLVLHNNGNSVYVENCEGEILNDYELASEDEVEIFLNELLKNNKFWDVEYKVIRNIYIPEPGEIVKVNEPNSRYKKNYMLCIMPNKKIPNKRTNKFFDLINICLNDEFGTECCFNGNIEPADENLKNEFFTRLHKFGLTYNKNKKCIDLFNNVKREKYQIYYYLDKDLNVCEDTEYFDALDNKRYNNGNYYIDEIDAIKESIKIKNINN